VTFCPVNHFDDGVPAGRSPAACVRIEHNRPTPPMLPSRHIGTYGPYSVAPFGSSSASCQIAAFSVADCTLACTSRTIQLPSGSCAGIALASGDLWSPGATAVKISPKLPANMFFKTGGWLHLCCVHGDSTEVCLHADCNP
jgi:hypothetical protein